MKNSFVFLGTGASAGVPVIGCDCAVCTSASPYNKRLRSSGLLKIGGRNFLIDAGPDFREQALRAKIHHLDALFLTHTHFDHIAGVDELRAYFFRKKKPIPCLLSRESFEDLKKRYYYLFLPIGQGPTLSVQLDLKVLDDDQGSIHFEGLEVGYFSFYQGGMKVTGYRILDFAYISDIRDYEETIFDELKGVKTLVLSALWEKKSDLHLSLDEAVFFAEKIKPAQTYLIHTNHGIDYESTNRKLPKGIRLAYDGLEIDLGH